MCPGSTRAPSGGQESSRAHQHPSRRCRPRATPPPLSLSPKKNPDPLPRSPGPEVQDVRRDGRSHPASSARSFASLRRVIFFCSSAAIASSTSGAFPRRSFRPATSAAAGCPAAQTMKMWPKRFSYSALSAASSARTGVGAARAPACSAASRAPQRRGRRSADARRTPRASRRRENPSNARTRGNERAVGAKGRPSSTFEENLLPRRAPQHRERRLAPRRIQPSRETRTWRGLPRRRRRAMPPSGWIFRRTCVPGSAAGARARRSAPRPARGSSREGAAATEETRAPPRARRAARRRSRATRGPDSCP